MSPAALARYRKARVTTNDPPGILLALLDGLERFLDSADNAFEGGEIATATEAAKRARAIVDELLTCLDRERAPELCGNLASLYSFSSRRLSEAIMQRNAVGVRDARCTLSPIIEAFRQAVPQARAEAETGRLAAVAR